MCTERTTTTSRTKGKAKKKVEKKMNPSQCEEEGETQKGHS